MGSLDNVRYTNYYRDATTRTDVRMRAARNPTLYILAHTVHSNKEI